MDVKVIEADQRHEDRVLPVGILAIDRIGLSPEAGEVESEEGDHQHRNGDDLHPCEGAETPEAVVRLVRRIFQWRYVGRLAQSRLSQNHYCDEVAPMAMNVRRHRIMRSDLLCD